MTSWFGGESLLTWPDFTVLGFLLLTMVSLGCFFRKQQKTTTDFFLGGRKVPWWAVCLSFVATEVSAVTVIAVPAAAYMENCEYLQFFIGSAAARLVIGSLFIPTFYKFKCTTIYQFLGARFGFLTQVTGTFFFFVTRLLGSGVRLMAACLAMSVLFGWHIVPVIVLFMLVGILYISLGGIKAVIWTNVVQALVFIGGGVATLVFLFMNIEGGFSAVWQVAGEAGKLKVMNWGPSFSEAGFWKALFRDPNIVWLAVLNGFFISLAAFGTDQDFMQRLLTVETRQDSQKSIAMTIPIGFSVVVIHLCIGVLLFVFYAQNPGLPLPEKLDKIFPHFIGHVMPAFLKGVMLSAIVLASIDSPLASLSASFVTDIYRPVFLKEGNCFQPFIRLPWLSHEARSCDVEKHCLYVSRIGIVVFGVILAVIAYLTSFMDKILWLAFKVWSVTFGSLLGVFLLGLLTQKKGNWANFWAMTGSAAAMSVLLALSELKIVPIGWSWLVIIGTVLTFAGGYVLGPIIDESKP